MSFYRLTLVRALSFTEVMMYLKSYVSGRILESSCLGIVRKNICASKQAACSFVKRLTSGVLYCKIFTCLLSPNKSSILRARVAMNGRREEYKLHSQGWKCFFVKTAFKFVTSPMSLCISAYIACKDSSPTTTSPV